MDVGRKEVISYFTAALNLRSVASEGFCVTWVCYVSEANLEVSEANSANTSSPSSCLPAPGPTPPFSNASLQVTSGPDGTLES